MTILKEFKQDNKVRNKYVKKVLWLVIGIIIGTSTIVGATTIFRSEDITYSSPTNKTNVKDSLDELYDLTTNYEFYRPLSSLVELGDYISMTPTSTSYTIPMRLTGADSDQTINPSNLNLWRVIKKNEDGTVEVVSHYVSDESIVVQGKIGYINYAGVLNEIAEQYADHKYVKSARHYGYNGQTKYIAGDKFDCKTVPWKSSTYQHNEDSNLPHYNAYESLGGGDNYDMYDGELVYASIGNVGASKPDGIETIYYVSGRRYVYNQELGNGNLYIRSILPSGAGAGALLFVISEDGENEFARGYSVRPILTFKANNVIKSGDGKSAETAYTFE